MLGLEKFGKGIGLHRLLGFVAAQGIDLKALSSRSVVVTGSNGKGSTARLLAEGLRAQGETVGLFTSPHLRAVTERFQRDGQDMALEAFERHLATVLAYQEQVLAPQGDRMGAFEALFLVALLWFAEDPPDRIVWEAGIGGRYDPVRVLGASLSVLTAVELEHAEILGPTLELIAYDKLDAVAPGGTALIAPCVPEALLPRLRAYGQVRGITVSVLAERFTVLNQSVTPDGQRAAIQTETDRFDLSLSLLGGHQVSNAVTALAALHQLFPERNWADLAAGLTSATWPGRLQRIRTEPQVWIDVGHTPKAVSAVVEALSQMFDPSGAVLLFGVSANKAVEDIAQQLSGRFGAVILTRAHKNGLDPEALRGLFPADSLVAVCPSLEGGVQQALAEAQRRDAPLVILGGLFLAIEAQECLEGRDPKRLVFF
ncbi:MAG: bifunctional folylpolyglutamate synthase/dihydrofolate synthase [Rhodospirillaceae bacterium]